MKANHTLSAAVLGTPMLTAIPVISQAQSQSEWLLKQQQMTDGHTTIRDVPVHGADLRWNGLHDPYPAAASRENNETQTKAGNT